MGPAAVTGSGHCSLPRDIAVAAASMWLLTIAPAVMVSTVPGASDAVRSRLAFALTPHEGSIPELLDIAETNARVVLAIALGAWARHRVAGVGLWTDLLVPVILAVNAVMVGVAAGAYGSRALPWLIHLPLEWTALAVVAGLHRVARRRTVATRDCALITAVALALVVVGALVETYITPQG